MNALYDTLNFLELIPLAIFAFCNPFGRKVKWIFILSFFMVTALLLFNKVHLIHEISLEKSIFFSVFLIVIWSLWIGIAWNDFWNEIKRR